MLHQVGHDLNQVGQGITPGQAHDASGSAHLQGFKYALLAHIYAGFGDGDAGRVDLLSLEFRHHVTDQPLTVYLDRVAGLVLDFFPKFSELGSEGVFFAQSRHATLAGVGRFGRQDALAVLFFDLAALFVAQVADGLAIARFDFFPVLEGDFALKLGHKALVAFVGHHGQDVDALISHPLAHLVYSQPHTAPDFLPLLHLGRRLVEGADLKDVGVVPSLPQGRVGEDERHRFAEGEQPLFVFHNQVVGFAVSFGLAGLAVFQDDLTAAGAPLGKVGSLHVLGVVVSPVWVGLLRLVEGAGEQSPDEAVLRGIVVHPVNEEEGEDLEAGVFEPGLLAHVFFDGVANLGLEDGVFVGSQFLAHGDFDVVGKAHVSAAETDLVNLKTGVFCPARLFLQ